MFFQFKQAIVNQYKDRGIAHPSLIHIDHVSLEFVVIVTSVHMLAICGRLGSVAFENGSSRREFRINFSIEECAED